MTSPKRLIEVAFPLKQTSLESVHEKMCHAGHPKSIHIWPARRPLAASRAALIATLLPDPANDVERKELLERLAGKVVERPRKKQQVDGRMVEELKEETEGGILQWGHEDDPDIDWFRQKIREAYGGRAPKMMDPFAGGGAIPLEAMRLGCEATAVDINPVAWFILKCTLEYPQKLAGQTRPLPTFAMEDREFMESFLKAKGYKAKSLALELEKLGFGKAIEQHLPGLETTGVSLDADLAWHVRAWGGWVLEQTQRDLARFYPTYADFEPLVEVAHSVERRPLTLVPLEADGTPDVGSLKAEFGESYLAEKSNPRWVTKPTVAFLWARTIKCKNCRATIPLMKTQWLAKKDKKRVVLTMQPNKEKNGVVFDVQYDIPVVGTTSAERKTHDIHIGGGTMNRSGAECPCCHAIMSMEDMRLEGQAKRIGILMTSIAVSGSHGKEFRLPTEHEVSMAEKAYQELDEVFKEIPFGIPDEPTPVGGGSGAGRAFSVQNYGLMKWRDLFTSRQLLALGLILKNIRKVHRESLQEYSSKDWTEAIVCYLAATLNKVADYNSSLVHWQPKGSKGANTFDRWALPTKWDFVENNILVSDSGGWKAVLDWVCDPVENHLALALSKAPQPQIFCQSAMTVSVTSLDIIVTDPPYYDAIPYSDLMDFFYIWLKRSLLGLSPDYDRVFSAPLSPKWDKEKQDGELIDDESRHDGNSGTSKKAYENGMFRAFQMCDAALKPDGRLVIVFAHKEPDAWETLVSAIIQAGFIVDGSWPIQTEMTNRTRSQTSAALASSVWLVCRKRPESTRPGWDNRVLEDMRANIGLRLRQFWDAGIRGPDFVWAATGPALEAYSQYPAVKKANQPGEALGVGEFLSQVRRMVVDFVVGRVLTLASGTSAFDGDVDVDVSSLDLITTYYLLHRNDFGLNDAPAGPCILYAVSCGLSDRDLADRYDLLARRGGMADEEEVDGNEEEENEGEPEEGSGSVFRLKAWNQRKRPSMGFEPGEEHTLSRLPMFPEMPAISESEGGYIIPLIDQVHRLMILWRAGDVANVDDYLDRRALRRNQLFHQLLQALIELSPAGSEERSLLESISNHVGGKVSNAQRLL